MSTILGHSGPAIKPHNSEKTPESDLLFLAKCSEKDKKWDAHRLNAEKIEAIYTAGSANFHRLADRMAKCSTWLEFAEKVCPDTAEIRFKLARASFCCVRHCPVCSWRRSLRNTARFFDRIPQIKEQFPTARFIFLTLTVPNCAPHELRAKIKEMNQGWQRLIQRKDWPALGFVRSVEVTRGRNGSAHPHFHALLMVKASYFTRNYIRQDTWLQNWRDAMRDQSITQVDIRTVKPKFEGQELHAAVVETLKYATKVTDAFEDPQWLYAMTEQLHKMRFLATGGELKKIFADLEKDATNDELIHGDEQPLDALETQATLRFSWHSSHGKYARKKN